MSTGSNLPGNLGHWVITAVIIIGIIGICYVMAGVAGIAIPPFIITILWIIFAVVVCVAAIRFLLSLGG